MLVILLIGVFTIFGAFIGIVMAFVQPSFNIDKRWNYPWELYSRPAKIAFTIFLIIVLVPMYSAGGGFIGLLATIPLSFAIDRPRHEEVKNTTPVYSLRDNRDIEGTFVLGSGTIDTVSYYYTMIRGDDGLVMRKWPAEICVARETDENLPVISERYLVPDQKLSLTFLGISWDLIGPHAQEIFNGYYLDVPPGTVTADYSIDLE